ncbi:hypothetical protein SKAU_G00070670 [Synaphobranchus kaupii]|uniref:Uncharacterized protein n=1 Tax=Synaphobranchus kaupii TaxID=118154 RepID=A0A9Q1JBP9_SYNKA|nr:hypothetical protein SKAU_G00070670 [Synaphobranchus kaupii]
MHWGGVPVTRLGHSSQYICRLPSAAVQSLFSPAANVWPSPPSDSSAVTMRKPPTPEQIYALNESLPIQGGKKTLAEKNGWSSFVNTSVLRAKPYYKPEEGPDMRDMKGGFAWAFPHSPPAPKSTSTASGGPSREQSAVQGVKLTPNTSQMDCG